MSLVINKNQQEELFPKLKINILLTLSEDQVSAAIQVSLIN